MGENTGKVKETVLKTDTGMIKGEWANYSKWTRQKIKEYKMCDCLPKT